MGSSKAKRAASIRGMLRNPPQEGSQPSLDPSAYPDGSRAGGYGRAESRRPYQGGYSRPVQEYNAGPTPSSGFESALRRREDTSRPKSRFERKERLEATRKAKKKTGSSKQGSTSKRRH